MNSKFPKAIYAIGYIKEVWQETFPNEKGKTLTRMERRREVAKMQKDLEDNQEYIDKI